jgi:hypothetical protein
VDSVHKTHAGNHPLALNVDGVRKWASAIPGTFKVSDLDAELGIKDKDDKLQRTAILEQMCKEGFLERVGQQRGAYRVKDSKAKVLSLDAPAEPEVKMWLPFGLQNNVRIQQKNIIIIAGETNAGKTSMMMNMAFMQRRHSHCTYMCSEMNGAELADKTASYGAKEEWDHCTFLERTRNFHDTIVPDGINYIDYLEIYDNFFAIGEDIRKIYDALTTGVAVIAIQKATGTDLGRGGAFTIEKARLSISLYSHGKMLDGIIGSAKVTKAKNIRSGWNPDGREIFYTLRGGYYFNPSDLPRISDLQTGWKFYDKKTRDKIIQRIESHCREHEVNEQMSNVGFYQ